eukprot:gene18735-21323_t
MSTASFVQVNVSGFPYSIAVSDIEKFPGSFFECMIKKEWLHDSVGAISIQRDGALFKFVNAYLVNGHLPRDKEGLISLDDSTLDGLKEEADFYGLDALSKECNTQYKKSSGLDIGSYLTIRKYIAGSAHRTGCFEVDHSSNLAQSLKCVWSHFCVRGKMKPYPYLHSRPLYKSTSVRSVNVEELIATATQSPFGRGTETVVDTAVRNSFEIDASMLDAEGDSVGEEEDEAVQDNGEDNEEKDEVGMQGDSETEGAQSANEINGISEGDSEGDSEGVSEADEAAEDAYVEFGNEYNDSDGEDEDEDEDEDGEYDAEDAGLDAFDDDDHDDYNYDYGDGDDYGDDYGDEYDSEEEAHHDSSWDYWEGQPRGNADPGCPRNPNDADTALIFEALDQDLKSFGTIIICLQHLYPECQTNPAFLKGGDRALYDILTSGNSEYDVQVVAATIYRSCDYNYGDYNETKGALFSPAIVKRTLGIKNDSDSEEEKENMRKLSAAVDTMQVKKVDSTNVASRAKLVLPNNLNADSLLDYTPYNDHTGNESQPEESVYIVAGLQVRVKK